MRRKERVEDTRAETAREILDDFPLHGTLYVYRGGRRRRVKQIEPGNTILSDLEKRYDLQGHRCEMMIPPANDDGKPLRVDFDVPSVEETDDAESNSGGKSSTNADLVEAELRQERLTGEQEGRRKAEKEYRERMQSLREDHRAEVKSLRQQLDNLRDQLSDARQRASDAESRVGKQSAERLEAVHQKERELRQEIQQKEQQWRSRLQTMRKERDEAQRQLDILRVKTDVEDEGAKSNLGQIADLVSDHAPQLGQIVQKAMTASSSGGGEQRPARLPEPTDDSPPPAAGGGGGSGKQAGGGGSDPPPPRGNASTPASDWSPPRHGNDQSEGAAPIGDGQAGQPPKRPDGNSGGGGEPTERADETKQHSPQQQPMMVPDSKPRMLDKLVRTAFTQIQKGEPVPPGMVADIEDLQAQFEEKTGEEIDAVDWSLVAHGIACGAVERDYSEQTVSRVLRPLLHHFGPDEQTMNLLAPEQAAEVIVSHSQTEPMPETLSLLATVIADVQRETGSETGEGRSENPASTPGEHDADETFDGGGNTQANSSAGFGEDSGASGQTAAPSPDHGVHHSAL